MATRCQILFQQERSWKNQETEETERRIEEVLTYKHWNGYPWNVVSLLQEYFQWMPRHDLENFTSTWTYFVKRRKEKELETDPVEQKEVRSVSPVTCGVRICGSEHLHLDISHFYIVKLDEKTIEHYSVRDLENADHPEHFNSREPDQVYQLEVEEKADENTSAGSTVQPAKERGEL
ncbi:MAG: hypothetical protein ABEJ07_02690 [Candidatus Nanohaloarchaea archaeon]